LAPEPEKILVVKLADFGDALLTTPALRALRETYPAAGLDVLTTPGAAPVYRHCELADDVLEFEKARYDAWSGVLRGPLAPLDLGRSLRARGYDTVVLLHHLTTRYGALKHAALVRATGAPRRIGLARLGSARGRFLTRAASDIGFGVEHEAAIALSIARAAGASTSDLSLAFEPGADARAAAASLLGERDAGSAPDGAPGAARRPTVAVHPGSGPYSVARRWPPERFAMVADALTASGVDVVLVGRSDDDTAGVRAASGGIALDLTDRTSLPTLAAVLARVDLLISNDSGVMHLATAMGTPIVAVFGPTSERAWGPWDPSAGDVHAARSPIRHTVVALDLPCRPCLYRAFSLGSRDGCPTRDCLLWLDSRQVVDAALESLSQPRL
jgi:heptosyltransferase-2